MSTFVHMLLCLIVAGKPIIYLTCLPACAYSQLAPITHNTPSTFCFLSLSLSLFVCNAVWCSTFGPFDHSVLFYSGFCCESFAPSCDHIINRANRKDDVGASSSGCRRVVYVFFLVYFLACPRGWCLQRLGQIERLDWT